MAVDCSTESIYKVLKQAQQIGMVTRYYHFFFTNLVSRRLVTLKGESHHSTAAISPIEGCYVFHPLRDVVSPLVSDGRSAAPYSETANACSPSG